MTAPIKCNHPGCQSVIPPQPSKDARTRPFARGPGWEGGGQTPCPCREGRTLPEYWIIRTGFGPPEAVRVVNLEPLGTEPTEQDRIDIDRSQFEATVQEAVLKFGAATVRKWVTDFVREKGVNK